MLNYVIMIPFVNICAQREAYKSELLLAEKEVLDSGCFIGGPTVRALEDELANYTDIPHAVTCGSGTDAITLALLAFGLEPEDEVIVPDFTFIACAECVAMLGAKPVFADIDPETLQISPESVASLVNNKTRGIIAVDLFGQCAPFTQLQEIATKHGLWILEDAAQAFGASCAVEPIPGNESLAAGVTPRRACTFGDIAITSFYPSKPLGCYGDGGALFTRDEKLAQKIRLLANHGSLKRYVHEICGMNSRLDALQAAVLRVKLRHLDDELQVRSKNALAYDAFFSSFPGIKPQKISNGNTSTYAQYTLLVDNRDSFLKLLESADVPYCIHYPHALHEQPCFKDFAPKDECSNSLKASQKVVSLPVCAFTDVNSIIDKIEKAKQPGA